MRNWINLFENMSIQGAHKDNMNVYEAKRYLDSHPDGLLHHDILNESAFITVTTTGMYVFFDDTMDQLSWRTRGKPPSVDIWDWKTDIKNLSEDHQFDIMEGWWYEPAQDFVGQTNFTQELWDDIREGRLAPTDNTPPQLG